jgi:hypothetical protein
MNLPEIAFEEVRWSPVETLLWIATRSHRFVNALAGVPFMSLEEHRGGIQRGNHAPHPMTLPNALQLLCRELERGSLHPAAGEVPGAGDGMLSMFSIDEFLHMEIWFRAAEVVRIWADWPPTEAWKAAKARPGSHRAGFPKDGSGAFPRSFICRLAMSSISWLSGRQGCPSV